MTFTNTFKRKACRVIAALAAGSDEGYIYVRAEYPLAV